MKSPLTSGFITIAMWWTYLGILLSHGGWDSLPLIVGIIGFTEWPMVRDCMQPCNTGYCVTQLVAVEVNLFWMAHQVHHSSEEYNLSTALRQSMMQRFTSWV